MGLEYVKYKEMLRKASILIQDKGRLCGCLQLWGGCLIVQTLPTWCLASSQRFSNTEVVRTRISRQIGIWGMVIRYKEILEEVAQGHCQFSILANLQGSAEHVPEKHYQVRSTPKGVLNSATSCRGSFQSKLICDSMVILVYMPLPCRHGLF